LKSASQSVQEHRFFEYTLNNDLDLLTSELSDRYEKIENSEILGVTPLTGNEIWKESNSVSTMKWQQYNVFQFHILGIRNLYNAVSEMVKEACQYYDIDFESQNFMLQGWFNINHAKTGKLDWHDHAPVGAPFFHGYYAVNAEPSETHYYAFDEHKINSNKNNRAILSEMGHLHAQGDWSWEGPRITVAYDIIPFSELQSSAPEQEQHWVPLR
jgi:hypothetical protein